MNSKKHLSESLAEDAVTAEQDHEVQMARADCFHAAQHAIKLHKLLGTIPQNTNLPGWMQEKISLSADYIRSVAEFLEHELAGPVTLGALSESQSAVGLTLDTIWRKVEAVVSQIYPDGDPMDYLVPWLVRQGVQEQFAADVLMKAAAKHGYRDIYDYYDSMGDLAEGEHPWVKLDEISADTRASYLKKNTPVTRAMMGMELALGGKTDAEKAVIARKMQNRQQGAQRAQARQWRDQQAHTAKLAADKQAQQRQADMAAKPAMIKRLADLEARLDPNYQQSDDYSFWRSQHAIAGEISWIKSKLASLQNETGVEEGVVDTIKRGVKNVKRGLQGWDKNAIGPGGERLGDPKDIVRRNKAHSDDMVRALSKDKDLGFPFGSDDTTGAHSPRGLQKRVLDREMKKRGLAEDENLRKENRLRAMIDDYEKRARATSNDLKKQHLLQMAQQLRSKLPTSDVDEMASAGASGAGGVASAPASMGARRRKLEELDVMPVNAAATGGTDVAKKQIANTLKKSGNTQLASKLASGAGTFNKDELNAIVGAKTTISGTTGA